MINHQGVDRMKKAGIITFLHNNNFGSTLQAYALQKSIADIGYDCVHLDYRPDTKEKILNLLRSGNDLKLVTEGMKKRSVQTGQAGARMKSESFDMFYGKHMKLTSVCRNRTDLKKQSAEMNILVCGSDQIWSPVWLNPAYFLDFAAEGQYRIAYAASLGVEHLPERRKIRKFRKLLKDFGPVSVREQEGAALLKEMTGLKAAVMPDPVCLLTREEWEKISEAPERKAPYILCYFIGESEQYWKQVDELQMRTGLEVVVLPVTAASYERPYSLADGASPEKFLGYVRDAAYVCTDSFHCALFSLIFGKMPRVFRRYREDDPESKNSRIDHLYRSLAISFDTEEPPASLRSSLDVLRNKGLTWLRENLEHSGTAGTEG